MHFDHMFPVWFFCMLDINSYRTGLFTLETCSKWS